MMISSCHLPTSLKTCRISFFDSRPQKSDAEYFSNDSDFIHSNLLEKFWEIEFNRDLKSHILVCGSDLNTAIELLHKKNDSEYIPFDEFDGLFPFQIEYDGIYWKYIIDDGYYSFYLQVFYSLDDCLKDLFYYIGVDGN